jgi:hypothetical protein
MRDTMVQAQAGVTDFQENMEAMKHNFFLRGYFKSRGYEDSAELAKNEIERCRKARRSRSLPTRRSSFSISRIRPS